MRKTGCILNVLGNTKCAHMSVYYYEIVFFSFQGAINVMTGSV
jgi:hypothetical protein